MQIVPIFEELILILLIKYIPIGACISSELIEGTLLHFELFVSRSSLIIGGEAIECLGFFLVGPIVVDPDVAVPLLIGRRHG